MRLPGELKTEQNEEELPIAQFSTREEGTDDDDDDIKNYMQRIAKIDHT